MIFSWKYNEIGGFLDTNGYLVVFGEFYAFSSPRENLAAKQGLNKGPKPSYSSPAVTSPSQACEPGVKAQ